MGTTRFAAPSQNKLWKYSVTTTAPRIINGDAGAPAKVEDPAFPMSNLCVPGRYLPWSTPPGTTPGNIDVHIDLLSNSINVAYIAFNAIRQLGQQGSIGWNLSKITPPGAYSSAGPWVQVASGSIGSSQRDQGFAVSPAFSARWWKLSFTGIVSTDGFSMKVWMGQLTDLGFLYSPGMRDQAIFPAIQSRMGSGHLTSVAVGDQRRLVTMPFRSVTDATKAQIDNIFNFFTGRDPGLWVDRLDFARNVVLATDSITWTHAWGPNNLWDCDLELEVLG